MKVSKLIELLQEFNQDADVTTSIAEDIQLSYISENAGTEYSKEDTPIVFIEPFDCLCCVKYDECEQHNLETCESPVMEMVG